MTTQTLDPTTIVKHVKSRPSDACGVSRHVYFFGPDLVIKDDTQGWRKGTNAQEYENYKKFKPGTFERDGRVYNIKFPHMEMVAGYLVVERVKHPLANHVCHCDCDYGTRRKAYWDEMERTNWTHEAPHPEHLTTCQRMVVMDIDGIMAREYNLYDMHDENFMWDAATRTAWIVDFAN